MDVYQVKWQQQINKGSGNQTYNFISPTNKAIWDANTINTAWDDSGCYAGAKAQNGSLVGSGSGCNFSGWNADTGKSDMRNFTIGPTYFSGTQNLRFMIDFGSGGRTINKKTFNWTGISNDQKTSIENAYLKEGDEGYRTDLQTPISVYSPYTRQYFNSSISGTPNTPLNLAPLNELKINDLIWLPKFLVKEVEYYNYNDTAAGYRNQTITTGTWYTWADVKPADKSPAGQYYDGDLFTKGYKEITAVNEDGVRYQYVAGVQLCPYYGKSSSTYNPSTDSYTSGTNPDDGFIYSARQIFGTYTSDTDTYPKVGTHTTNRPLLYVCSEIYNAMTGGITYQIPTGILFGNVSASGTISSDFNVQSQWQFAANAQLITSGGISVFYTNFWVNNNQYYNGIFKGVNDPTTESVNPDFYVAGSIAEIDGSWISTAMNDNTYPAAVHYYLQNNTPMSFSFAKTNRTINPQTLSYFSIQELWATIASLGCYVADGVDCATTAQTGRYVGNNNHLYLGYMDSSGITNGTMLQGKDIEDSVQAGIDDIIQNTPYTPVTPGPGGGGGGDDPSSPPTPSGKGEGKITGDATTGIKDRFLGTGSIQYYALAPLDTAELKTLLWAQAKTFYEAIQIAGRQSASIFDYISSFRYYPASVSAMGFTTGNASDIYLGTGAKFQKTDGTDYQLVQVNGFVAQFDWCRWDLSTFSGWRNNFLDYSPYCKLSIYLPYAGTFDLDLQTVAAMMDITQTTILVSVCIDINTGSMTYYVDADNCLVLNRTVKLGVDLPISGNDAIQQSTAILQTTYNNASQLIGEVSGIASAVNSGSVADIATSALQLPVSLGSMSLSTALANRQVPTQVSSFGGALSSVTQGQDPYITIYRQKIANPSNYGHTVGYLTDSTHTIDDLSGWTICSNPDLSGIAATTAELDMIQQILTSGFYA